MKKLFLKKRICAVFIFLMLCITINAQSETKHIVKRGETLESIANKYGTTTDEIIKLNPDAAQFVYAGMELRIPSTSSNVATIKNDPVEPVIPKNNEPIYQATDDKSRNYKNLNDFSRCGIMYRASFEDVGHGFYGLEGTVLHPGWGINFCVGTNLGLVDSDFASTVFYVGPCYAYVFDNSNVIFTAAFDFVGVTSLSKSPEISTTDKGNTYTSVKHDSKFSWGLALTPQIGINLDGITPYFGLDFQWSKDAKKIAIGFVVGIGCDI